MRWSLRDLDIYPNACYNYRKNRRASYHRKKQEMFHQIKSIYYNNSWIPGYRPMKIFPNLFAVEKALGTEKPGKGPILHSDQGIQHASWEFVDYCKKRGIRQSMSKAGCPYDNAPMERFYNTFKSELICPDSFPVRKVWMKQSEDMCTYGITMSVPIRTMAGRHHSRRDIERKFFELSVTKKFDQYNYNVFGRKQAVRRSDWKAKSGNLPKVRRSLHLCRRCRKTMM